MIDAQTYVAVHRRCSEYVVYIDRCSDVRSVHDDAAREDIVHPDGQTGVLYPAGTQIATLTTDTEGNAESQTLSRKVLR